MDMALRLHTPPSTVKIEAEPAPEAEQLKFNFNED